jgi:hypothetical protein
MGAQKYLSTINVAREKSFPTAAEYVLKKGGGILLTAEIACKQSNWL